MYSSLNFSRLSRLLVSCVGKKIISHTAAVLALGIMTFSSFAQTSTSIDVVTQSRQILQMAEYIGVDYSEAVVDGEIASEDEFAEMQQFAKLILQKGEVIESAAAPGFDLSKTSVLANARALQQAILAKASMGEIQSLTLQIRQELLAISPALKLPSRLLPQAQVDTLFAENCAACHGPAGKGDGPLA
ncbi:MAG: c-type cytochrome, partial [Paraglaciecola chathamensis]